MVMALATTSLVAIKQIMDRLNQAQFSPKRIMSLGYPDMLVHPQQIRQIFGEQIASQLQFHPDSESIARWHGFTKVSNQIVESEHFFRLLGYELEIVDIVQGRGREIIVNLNEPAPENLSQRYVLVIDGGTCEHCFNIAQAVKNLANMVMKSGFIMQGNPFNMYNHGFYNLNPTWYYDFYLENGFQIHDMKIIHNGVFNPVFYNAPPYQRFSNIPENSSLAMIAQRIEIKEIKWPIQTKYKNNPTLKG
jgi:hypothetical protein